MRRRAKVGGSGRRREKAGGSGRRHAKACGGERRRAKTREGDRQREKACEGARRREKAREGRGQREIRRAPSRTSRSIHPSLGLATTSEMTSRRADGPSADTKSPISIWPRRRVPRSSRRPAGSGAARMRIDDISGLTSSAGGAAGTPRVLERAPPRGSTAGGEPMRAGDDDDGNAGSNLTAGDAASITRGVANGVAPTLGGAALGGSTSGSLPPRKTARICPADSSSVKSWKMNAHGGRSAPPHGRIKPISSLGRRRTWLPFPTF